MQTSFEPRLIAKLGIKTSLLLSKLHNGGFYDGNFIEVNDELCDELGISMFQFRKIRDFCKVLDLVAVTRNGKPNRTKLSLNLARYNDVLTGDQTDFGIKP